MSALFWFHIDGDEKDRQKRETARGLGHAYRCLALARVWKKATGEDPAFVINPSSAARSWAEQTGIRFFFETHLSDAFTAVDSAVLFVDINYLEPAKVAVWAGKILIVNLAPRGAFKYTAHLSYLDTAADVDPNLGDASASVIMTGASYAVTGASFTRLRSLIRGGVSPWNDRTLTVAMGGSDPWNFTTLALRAMRSIGEDVCVRLILGPHFRHEAELSTELNGFRRKVEIYRNPENFAEIISESSVGIFSGGITMFEALSVGVPSWNICATHFHVMRCRELEKLGITYGSTLDSRLIGKNWSDGINRLLSDRSRLEKVRTRALTRVDGNGARRIVHDVIKRSRHTAALTTAKKPGGPTEYP